MNKPQKKSSLAGAILLSALLAAASAPFSPAYAQAGEKSRILSTGLVVVKSSAVISAKIPSYVVKVYADAGDRVRKGGVLIKLDDAEFVAGVKLAEAKLAEAEASLEMARLDFERMGKLLAKGSATQNSYDMARTAHAKAKAGVALARAGLEKALIFKSYAVLKSPLDGEIQYRKIEEGELTAPGAPLLKVVDTEHLRFETAVKESRINSIKPGEKVKVRIEALGPAQDVEGTVSQIVPVGDVNSHSYIVRIDLAPTAGLMAGMYGKIRWP